MSNGRFSLFPGAPSAHNLFSKRAIQYQWRSNGPVFTSAIIIACVAVWVVEMVFSLFWHARLGLQVLIEDYIHDAGSKFAAISALNLATIGGGAFGIFSVATLAFGGNA